MKYICRQCNKNFYRDKKGYYCSVYCFGLSKRGDNNSAKKIEVRKKISLSSIGKPKKPQQGFQKGHRDFVPKQSRKQQGKKMKGAKNPFYNKTHEVSVRVKIALSKIGIPSVLKGIRKPHMSGKNHPNWKGNPRDKLKQYIRRLYEYDLWRESVFKRDEFTCQICKEKGGYLNVDHYPIPFAVLLHKNNINNYKAAKYCKELWNINNGRTLCKECHKKTDTYLMSWSQMKKLYC